MAAMVALAMTGVAVPPAAAWTYPAPEGEVWTPPRTPLGGATTSVEGHDAKSAAKPAAKPADWKPETAPPVVTGTETVTLGPDSPGAKSARSATGGASPASGGGTGSKAGALAVSVAPGNGTGESAHTVTVQVAGQDKGKAAGVTGPLVALTDAEAPGKGDGRAASVTLDLKALQAAGWSDRATLVALPSCALTTPEREECRTRTPVPATLDGQGKVTADVKLPSASSPQQPSGKANPQDAVNASFTSAQSPATAPAPAGRALVLAAAPAPSGPGGSYTATPLSPSAGWKAGSNSGNFTYSYPIQVPPSLGGAAPAVGLDYNSAAVDGRTSATNSQSSWVGDGWGYEPGYIERSYRGCDKAGITGSADQCWAGQNATLSLGSRSGTIVRDDATGVWHLQSDDGSKIEQLTGAPKAAGDTDYRDMEYWRITTTDGIQYYFGRNHLPGGDGSDPSANSVLTTPVYSPNSGDPCYGAGSGKNSWCQMAWRWQLDYVVDPHGNLTTYKYATEGNKYSRGGAQNNGNDSLTDYQRAGYLKEIGYGQRLDDQKAAKGALNPAAKVLFTVDERCKASGSITCAESQRTTANADAWPDVPIDQICTGSGACSNYAPTFFTTKRLTAITTQVLVDSAYRDVDTWALSQSLADPGDGTKRTLQLDSVQRTGSNGQAPISLPAVSFTYVMMANRVDGLVPAAPMFMRPRIQGITTETGGRINVIYSDPECSRVNNHMPASEDNNSMACMPVKWYLPGQSSPDPVNDWFNKPLVRTITEQDLVATPPIGRTTEYTYNGGAAWHRNDAEFTDPKTRTWDNFRGYQSVTTTTGSGSVSEAPKTQQTVTYLRGMDGDYLANGSQRSVQVASPLGDNATDSDWLSGRAVATENYDQAGGRVQAVSGSTTNGQAVTATHSQTAGAPKVYARYPDSQVTTISRARLTDGTWRTATAVTTTDPSRGNRITQVDDKGDGTAATPETCTTTGYATSDNPLRVMLASEVITVQGPCGTTPSASNTIAGSRTLFDGKAVGKAGATGDPTSTQVLDHFDQAGSPVYTLNGSATFDAYGRALTASTTDGSAYDRSGNLLSGPSVTPAVTTTVLTPATGALPTEVRTTGPMGPGWTTTLTQDPARGSPLTSLDLNGRTATAQYDALGRITAAWAVDRPTTGYPSKKFTYAVNSTAGPSTVKTETITDDGVTYDATINLFDGLGRPRQTQSTSAAKPTGRLITDTVYDTHGWVIKTSNPYYENSSFPTDSIFIPVGDGQIPGQTWNTYDGSGRVLRSEFRSYGNLQWATSTAYPGADRTDVTPPVGATPTSTVNDARGHTTALWQYRTATATGNAADADVTTYGFTAGGATAQRTDSSGNTWKYGYDLRGRQVSASDPDTGVTKTVYDANSRIDHTTDAKDSTLSYSYDLLGRKTAQYSGTVAPANLLASWTYDTILKGQPTSSSRYVGGADGAAYTKAVTDYDTAYRPLGTSVTIPSAEGALAGTYTTTNTYSDVIGSLTKVSVPAAGGLPAETVSYGRTITGLLTSAASLGKAVIAKVDYDALARPVRTTVGEYGKQVVSTQQYDWATGRVVNNFVDRQLGTVSVDQTSYTYTPSGRVTSATSVQDAAATDTQCFTYDYLGRLASAWTDTGGTSTTADWSDSSGQTHGTGSSSTVPGVGSCNNATGPASVSPGGRTVGGPAPYWNTYSYDATGNRTGLVQHDITGNSLNDTTTAQTFGASRSNNTPTNAADTGGGTGGPHALLTSTTTGPGGTKAVSYQYDAKGRTTSITDTGGTSTLTWNGEDKLDNLARTGQTDATTYLYDADGNQLIRRNPGKTTLSLATDELTLDTASGSMSNVRTIAAPGGLTYTRVTAAIGGGKVLIQASDPHGTANLQINTTAGQPVTRRPSDPFGNPRGEQPQTSDWAGTKGFIGGSKDDTTGLTSLGARQYDPATGRFISPDPLLVPTNPQQWNGYAYSENDPVNLSDPSGLSSEECGKLYDCHGGSITMKNTAETGGYFGGPNGQRRYYETIKDDTQSVENQWVSKQISKNLNSPWISASLGNTLSKVWQTAKEISGLDDAEECGKRRTLKSCMGALEAVGSLISGTRLESLALKGLARTLTKEEGATPGATTPHNDPNPRFPGCPVPLSSHSFPPDTQVLMSDGSAKPIGQVQPGDSVTATDPQTGVTSTEPVTKKIVTPDDTHFTELTLAAPDKQADATTAVTLTSTTHHPYWDDTAHRWIPAQDLQPGHHVTASDHTTLVVLSTRTYNTAPQTANDLTVANLHTYYVLAGNAPVLAHNSTCGPVANNKPGDLALEMMEADFAGVSPMTAGTPEFAQAVSGGGRYLWAVGENGALHIIPDAPGIHHTVMTGGNSVIGAGQVTITSRGVVSSIDNMTGHYTPCPQCAAQFLQQGVNAFEQAGIRVPLSAIKDYGGRAP
ncbi:RHS repeat-associated core domain-containing protein [Kitasatospora sp. NPDC051705]|uniref:RHS repeat-associated core domain-containing protein n=1 Tax=Kitasatospora sp. NPDC051705 TaxID=3364057 RepID=UPI0037A426B6